VSTDQNKTLLRRWIGALNTRNENVLDKLADGLYTADYVLHDPGLPTLLSGPVGGRQSMRGAFATIPDGHITVEELIAEGDKVASHFKVYGTDVSTGQATTLVIMAISRFSGAKIAEEWEFVVPAAKASDCLDPVVVVKALDAACNAGDLERVVALFADDAVLKDPLASRFHAGQQQIREWFRPQLQQCHVTSTNHQVTGDSVTWEGTVSADMLRQRGIASLDEMAEAVVRGGKIRSLAWTVIDASPEMPRKGTVGHSIG
jgi:ketosteroid isomerase-like protein